MAEQRFQCRRIYDDPSPDDGMRVLVDRLWPRGIRKDDARLDQWAKDLAPSTDLRRTFHDGDMSFSEFSKQYRMELSRKRDALQQLLLDAAGRPITLLFASRNTEQNHAHVLRDVLQDLITS